MDKLNLNFSCNQVLSTEDLNSMVVKINQIVNAINNSGGGGNTIDASLYNTVQQLQTKVDILYNNAVTCDVSDDTLNFEYIKDV